MDIEMIVKEEHSVGKLNGKTAVITGASKGIGAGIALAFAKEGANVVVNYARGKDDAEKVAANIKNSGGKSITVQADVSKKSDVDKLFAYKGVWDRRHSREQRRRVRIRSSPGITEESYRRMFDLNVLGTLLSTQAAVKSMTNGGSVINLSSVASLTPPPAASVYSATKGAVDVITRSLAQELGPQNIRVNSLAPGLVETEGTKAAGTSEGEFRNLAVSRTPLGRVGAPQDIAKVAVFLASDDAAWITGEVLPVGGGARL